MAYKPGVNWVLIILLVLGINGLILVLGLKYNPKKLLVPGILCMMLTIFMYFFAQQLLNKTFANQRTKFIGELR